MTEKQFMAKIRKQFANYDFCGTVMEDVWLEQMSDRALRYLESQDCEEFDKLTTSGDNDIGGWTVGHIMNAFLWYLIKDSLKRKELKKHIKTLKGIADDKLYDLQKYLESLLNGDFLLKDE